MPSISGLSASQLASYRMEAQRLVAQYDRNGDGRISRDEAQQAMNMGSDSYSFSNRISNDYVEVTTVFQDHVNQLRPDGLAAADLRGDGEIDADEIVEAYLRKKDSNHNGSLSWWEKLSMSTGGMRDMFENQQTIETNRTTRLDYDPEQVIVVDPGPVPPSPDPFRPVPPPVIGPGPRPTPPSPFRPTPPVVGPGPRPTPPSPRPTPPSPSRPTPPSPGGRPTPPRA